MYVIVYCIYGIVCLHLIFQAKIVHLQVLLCTVAQGLWNHMKTMQIVVLCIYVIDPWIASWISQPQSFNTQVPQLHHYTQDQAATTHCRYI